LEALILTPDGDLHLADGTGVDPGDPAFEIAWCSSDLYFKGSPLRKFFQLMLASKTLRLFQTAAAGYDQSEYGELARGGVRICNSNANSIPIAEFVVRSVLDLFQNARDWRSRQEEHLWATHDFREIYASTWLVVGLGSIGAAVSSRVRAFGATVIGCRRTPSGNEPVDRMIEPAEIPEVLPSADVVVIAAPATAHTRHLVDSGFLGAMKPGSILVNIARGSLIDEDALIAALDRGIPQAAVLDVFATEPLPPSSPLWDHPSVIATPHNAALGGGRFARQTQLFVDNVDRYLAGRELLNEVTEAAKES
jgi:phosphoglycerate dehydrogenase-like enzyme